MTRTIEVIVSPQGETKVSTHGFAGNACQDASRFLEQTLGQRAGEELTAEFYQQTTAQNSSQEQA